MKKMIYVCNVKEEDIGQKNQFVHEIKEYIGDEHKVVEICGKIVEELA